jgi:glucosyl-dolichyl phosphate glucuronosyltransferase
MPPRGTVASDPENLHGAMRLSVVIPTRDRPELLADCLRSLAQQALPAGGMEVLVVDDGSRKPVALDEPVGEIAVACLRQSHLGLNAARNRGAEAARGELVAFVDDDVIAPAGWAAAVDGGFTSTGCDALGGRISLRPERPLPEWLTDEQLAYLSRYDLGDAPRQVGLRDLPFGANFALQREALERLGGFRADLDRVGETLISNGETELLRRLLREGGRIVYWPAAEVAHRVTAERLTRAWFRERALAQGISDLRTEPAGARTDALLGHLLALRETIRAARELPRLIGRLARGRSRFDLVLWREYWRGRRLEAKRLRLR